MSALVPMLQALRKEDAEALLLKPPASPSAVREAEGRLGTELPDGLGDFYLISNGADFMPSIDVLSFRPVEELRWECARDRGLHMLTLDLGCTVQGKEWEQLPTMDRMLVISDSHSEELMGYIDAEAVGQAMSALKDLGHLDDTSGEPGWRLILFRHWDPELRWIQGGFRGYIEELAHKAEWKGATLAPCARL
ncbi:hypothetical protein DAEQUDRAFT_726687 [Daedalea quercina L-15889]|uniref:Knr4/Smi1-like domain-containing protein n=1 Tax=Daedalea quercina L-15889 TaxID=1314783 RepID=A0A165QFF5_9APHY|nr:hypothetical protein DAEQUDRAFT_726687 [Daedalea quercina L-15889]